MVKKSKVAADSVAVAAADAAPASTWEEMEHKREAMTNSLKALGAAMQLCTNLIADYTAVSSTIPRDAPLAVTPAIEVNGAKRKLSKKDKIARDPNKPKRPASAYLLFQIDYRKQLAETNPGMPNNALMAALGEKWQQLTEEEKKPYQAKYDLAQAEWRTQTDAYNETLPDSEKPKSRAAPRKKKADIPAPEAAAATEASSSEGESDTEDELAAEQVTQPAESETSESDTSESEDTESEDTVSTMPPLKKVKTTVVKSVPAPPKPAPAPVQPTTPVAKPASKKEKKKELAAASTPTTPAAVTKPKKKKVDKA